MSKSWDSNVLKKLKALTGKGLSTAEIGKKLGMSKNAVVGKLHRLGWNLKATENATSDAVAEKKGSVKKTIKKIDAESKKISKTTKEKSSVKKTGAVSNEKMVVKNVSGADVKKSDGNVKNTSKDVTKSDKSIKVVVKQESEKTLVAEKEIEISGKNLAMHQRIIQHSLELAALKPNQCRWPIGDPDSDKFHFCGQNVFAGKPYCYEHCRHAYQFTTPPKKK